MCTRINHQKNEKGKRTSRRLARTWANGVTISCSGVLSSNDDDDVVGLCPPNKFYKNIVVGIHHGRNVLLSPSSHGPQAAFTKTFDIMMGIIMPKPYQSGSSNDACPLRLLGILG